MWNQEHSPIDVFTIAAISIAVFLLHTVLHELLGHGAAFLMMGASLKRLTLLSISADVRGLAPWQIRLVFGAGSWAVILGALACLTLLHLKATMPPHARYFLWLSITSGLILPGAHLSFAWLPITDWYFVTAGLRLERAARLFLTIAGAGLYGTGMWIGMRELEPFLGSVPRERAYRARVLLLVPYFTICAVSASAALVGRAQPVLFFEGFFISLRLAGLCFIRYNVANQHSVTSSEPLVLARNNTWLIIGAVALIISVPLLGPGIELGGWQANPIR